MARRQLSNKRVIITGASSGIGWHLARQLAAAGANVVINGRRSERLEQLAEEIKSAGGTCVTAVGDISDPDARANVLQVCVDTFGGLDILINNAGVGAMGRFDEATPDRLYRIFEVNFFAAVEFIRSAIPQLKLGNDPLIVNIGSVLGHRAAPLKSEYSASKFALHGFCDSLRAELSVDNIDVLLVSPSTTASEFFDSTIEDNTGKQRNRKSAMPPETVAAKTVRAIQTRKHEIILSVFGKLLVWLDRLMPNIANRVVAKWGQ